MPVLRGQCGMQPAWRIRCCPHSPTIRTPPSPLIPMCLPPTLTSYVALSTVHHVSGVHKPVPGPSHAELCFRVPQDNRPPGNMGTNRDTPGMDSPVASHQPDVIPYPTASYSGYHNSPSWAELHPFSHRTTPCWVCWAKTQQPRSAGTQFICSSWYWGTAVDGQKHQTPCHGSRVRSTLLP